MSWVLARTSTILAEVVLRLELPQSGGSWWEKHWRGGSCLREVMAGAATGRCWLELYDDPSCLIGEASGSRKEVSRLANSLGSTV